MLMNELGRPAVSYRLAPPLVDAVSSGATGLRMSAALFQLSLDAGSHAQGPPHQSPMTYFSANPVTQQSEESPSPPAVTLPPPHRHSSPSHTDPDGPKSHIQKPLSEPEERGGEV